MSLRVKANKICLRIKAVFDKYYLPPVLVRRLNVRRSFERTVELPSRLVISGFCCYFVNCGSDFLPFKIYTIVTNATDFLRLCYHVRDSNQMSPHCLCLVIYEVYQYVFILSAVVCIHLELPSVVMFGSWKLISSFSFLKYSPHSFLYFAI